MNWGEFTPQMDRLINTFGKSAYGEERTKLIWREVKDFSGAWWEKSVDQLILSSRQAPLLEQFGPLIADERERLWKIEKKKHAQEAKDFFRSSYGPDDVGTICKTIVKRIQGEVSDSDYSTFQKMLNNVAASNPNKNSRTNCRGCEDSGLIFHRDQENYEWIYRCRCHAGMRQPQTYPIYQQ